MRILAQIPPCLPGRPRSETGFPAQVQAAVGESGEGGEDGIAFGCVWVRCCHAWRVSVAMKRRLTNRLVPICRAAPLLLMAMAVVSCSTPKEQGAPTSNLPSNLRSISFASTSRASPPHGMSRYEYPFDASGNYVESWARDGEIRAGRSTAGSTRQTVSSTSRPTARPTATPTRRASTPAASSARTHTVARGDTLYSLSRRYGVSVSAIQSANGIRGTTIQVGQRLRIPR
jgi:hypothetical protein